jgi:hypothetical protein
MGHLSYFYEFLNDADNVDFGVNIFSVLNLKIAFYID